MAWKYSTILSQPASFRSAPIGKPKNCSGAGGCDWANAEAAASRTVTARTMTRRVMSTSSHETGDYTFAEH